MYTHLKKSLSFIVLQPNELKYFYSTHRVHFLDAFTAFCKHELRWERYKKSTVPISPSDIGVKFIALTNNYRLHVGKGPRLLHLC